jgi:hypothetical protein
MKIKTLKLFTIGFLSFCFFVCGLLQGSGIADDESALTAAAQQVPGSFPLVNDGNNAKILYDSGDAPVVKIAAEALDKDIALITGSEPGVTTSEKEPPKLAVIIGTLDRSSFIQKLSKANKIPADRIRGKWESFLITTVDQPLGGIDRALVIAGSDPRGTAFGVFELSKRIGVSPWYWWADVRPEKHDRLFVVGGPIVEGPPSVKYRGIFLNDEDWGLKPWASANIDADIKDIGPKTYAKIFELLLRLKANLVWPAMHGCTKAFYYYKDNPKTADQYAIVVGSSHCEPMLRNNVDEWTNNYQAEYGKAPGPWRYDTNQSDIHRYWDDRAKESSKYESVYTIGMRGIHDSDMPGPKETDKKIALLDKVIADQREILSNRLQKPIQEIPQIFCPYKEVLLLYEKGIALPDDITIVWADDNHGFIRQLSTPKEQLRSGKSGVYYHFSYWGSPNDYLWLSSISPELISYEMNKAYQFGADRLWIFNVGDLKPAEAEIEFSMDLAWDIGQWPPEKAHLYIKDWSERTFGREFADRIADIKHGYYLLAQTGKPEHLDLITFSRDEARRRLEAYQRIAKEAEELGAKMPDRLKDAYFQLILYPTLCACHMNEKFIYAAMSVSPQRDPNSAADCAEKAKHAFSEIQRLTRVYNQEIAGGKWNKMMYWKPHDLPVFRMPSLDAPPKNKNVFKPDSPVAVIAAADFSRTSDASPGKPSVIKGLGVSGASITILPVTNPSIPDENAAKAPFAEYEIQLPAGQRTVEVICVPTHRIHDGRGLRYAVSFNDESPTIVNVDCRAETPPWEQNVLRGYSIGKSSHKLDKDGIVKIRLSLLDTGLLISQIRIY